MSTAADWGKPVVGDAYANWPGEITGRDNDLAVGLDPAIITVSYPTTNLPTGAKRFNGSNNKWEKWNGTTWADMATTYAISISGSSATLATGRTVTVSSDATGTSSSFDGSGNVTLALTLASTITAAGPIGSATLTPVITYDAKGRLTTVTTATIAPAWGSVTGKPTTLAGYGIATGDSLFASGIALGSATASTQAYGTGNTTVATTAYADGMRSIPQNQQNAGYTFVAQDKGKFIYGLTAGAFTIPLNILAVGDVVSYFNSAGTCTLVPAASVTLYWHNGTSLQTGTRTIANGGMVTFLQVGTNAWSVSGTGIT